MNLDSIYEEYEVGSEKWIRAILFLDLSFSRKELETMAIYCPTAQDFQNYMEMTDLRFFGHEVPMDREANNG